MSALTYQLAFAVGALFVSFLVLGLLLYICEKLRRKPNGPKQIAGMGLLSLIISTVLGGFGMQDGGPEPMFSMAFVSYFGPVMTATVIHLMRLCIRLQNQVSGLEEVGGPSSD